MSSSKRICRRQLVRVVLLYGPLWLTPALLTAQQESTPPQLPDATQPADATPAPIADAEADREAGPPIVASGILADEQSQLADKYRRLEDLIFKMADFEATSNPRRSALLKQAYKQSKDRLTQSQLNSIVKLLQDQQYKNALDGQEIAKKDLRDLLQLLLSEDRSDRLKTETQKIQDYIKELKRLERLQRGVRGRTESASDPRDLAKDQEKVADRTGDLAKQLAEADGQGGEGSQNSQDEGSPPPSDGDAENADGQPQPRDDKQDASDADSTPAAKQDGQKPSGKPGEEQDAEQQQGQGSAEAQQGESSESRPGAKESQQGSPGQPQDRPPGAEQGEPQSGEQQSGEQPPQEEDSAKKRVREAEQRMRQAQQKLEEAKRGESVEKQTEALEKLQEAIAELEQILRQLREEEMERVLAMLEGRFRKMLEMELKVYEGTLRIDKIPEDQRSRVVDIRSSKLAFDQRKIAGDADRCLTLLLEEGSSIAFPEVVEQLRDDMEDVSARLDQTKVDRITQGLEEEIIGTLEELIEALQKAQQEMEEDRSETPGQPGEGGDPPLVDVLAELKMIRSLQLHVNSRTKRYSRLLDDPEDSVGQAVQEDLRAAIGKLSDLETRIQRITRDIVLGKNR